MFVAWLSRKTDLIVYNEMPNIKFKSLQIIMGLRHCKNLGPFLVLIDKHNMYKVFYLNCLMLTATNYSTWSSASTFQNYRYPEINSENSWNFTKYPEIFTKCSSLLYQLYMMLLIPDFFLFSKCAFSILENPKNSWKFLKFGRSGSIIIIIRSGSIIIIIKWK